MLFSEADPVVANAQALFAVLALEFFNVAGSVLGQPVDRRENVQGDVLGNGADVGFGKRGAPPFIRG